MLHWEGRVKVNQNKEKKSSVKNIYTIKTREWELE